MGKGSRSRLKKLTKYWDGHDAISWDKRATQTFVPVVVRNKAGKTTYVYRDLEAK